MLIMCDVDSTLYDANALFYKVGRNEFDIEWPKKYNNWFSAEDIGTDLTTLKNVFKRCHSKEYVAVQKPFANAASVIKGIAEDFEEVEVAYVSDRNEAQTSALKSWLDSNGFLVNPDTHVYATKDKRHWMRERKPEIVIDDRVRTILMARFELNSQVIAIEHDYNINLKNEADGIFVVKDWLAVDNVLRERIIPQIQSKAVSHELEKRYAIV